MAPRGHLLLGFLATDESAAGVHGAVLARTALIPIVGPRSLPHLEHYLRSLELELSEQHYRRLDDISAVRLGTPHEDVAAALDHGLDGDRTLLQTPYLPVI
ncbi:MAG: hypothetical protein ACQSGP_23080 [Frankia sp.]